nr:flavin reductase [Rhizobium sp. NFR07]
MSRVGAAVSIVTTMFDGEPFGFTASAVCSVSDAPPTLLACINKGRSSFPAFKQARYLCVNTLSWSQTRISDAFGSKIGMFERFTHGPWINGKVGSVVRRNESLASRKHDRLARKVQRRNPTSQILTISEPLKIPLNGFQVRICSRAKLGRAA